MHKYYLENVFSVFITQEQCPVLLVIKQEGTKSEILSGSQCVLCLHSCS